MKYGKPLYGNRKNSSPFVYSFMRLFVYIARTCLNGIYKSTYKRINGAEPFLRLPLTSLLIGLLFTILSFACKQQTEDSSILRLSSNEEILFLDSTQASLAIITDEYTDLFQSIRKIDMEIQMKESFPSDVPRESMLEEYKKYLQADVEDFSSEEIELLRDIFKEAYELSNRVSKNLFPERVKLIKTKANHYGRSAYYTRDNCIIIPANELEEAFPESILGVMLHELSHIYTRLHPQKAAELYGHIGFKKLAHDLIIPDSLSLNILLNPDGVDFRYGIEIQDSSRNILAVPIIRSNENRFKPFKQIFFQYLQFDLYEAQKKDNVYTVLTTPQGGTTLNWNNNSSFYQQITMNTDYIIHPDEIIADNFMLLILSEKDKKYVAQFSEDGMALQERIRETLMTDDGGRTTKD